MSRTAVGIFLGTLIGGLAACGDNLDGVPDEILPADIYFARCEAPRSGSDINGDPFPDISGSMLDEKLWIRSWTDDTYLWYREVPDLDIQQFATAVTYFRELKTPVTTASGKLKDDFHFDTDTADWLAMSQSGVEAGYGVQWALLEDRPPRSLFVAYAQPGSPAAAVNLDRGAQVITIDGVDFKNGSDTKTLNDGLSPGLNEKHTFVVIDRGTTTPRTVMMTATSVEIAPVQHTGTLPAPNDKVGYFLFTDHIATAEKALIDAINLLKTRGVTDLILDIRYNGGGYLAIASELAYMIAGPNATAGKAFERLTFNDKHPTTDPVTGETLRPEPFFSQTVGLSVATGQALPFLGLSRVFVLTSKGTCSASEAVMNGLAGIGVQVIQIGEVTCGKPYGFYPQDNCGTTYFSIQFQGVNEKGFGDYADGFLPGGLFPGCIVADDFTHALGDPAEARTAAALAYRTSATCPTVVARQRLADPLAAVFGVTTPKPQWRQNLIATHPRITR
jgi:carboxyl-terminal processing protease